MQFILSSEIRQGEKLTTGKKGDCKVQKVGHNFPSLSCFEETDQFLRKILTSVFFD